MNRIEVDGEIQIPGGAKAIIAQYRDHKLSEYNNNPMIQALPPIFSPAEFVDCVTRIPKFSPEEREFEAHHRFHCIERLSRYFDPQTHSIELHKLICVLLMQGYLGRNLVKSGYAQRSRQIYEALKAKDGKSLEDYVTVPSSASSLTLIGPSGIGKTTNLINILELYPQVIAHPEHSVYQLVWLKVECPHAGSLKGLCIDIFLAIDKLLGTNYFKKFGSRGNSEDYMLAQVAQVIHTHHLGILVIDEMQNLLSARRGRDELLNFLVKMDNIIGVPVIRVGTNEAFSLFQGNFRNARRATGKAGVLWDRMPEFEMRDGEMVDAQDWLLFIEGIWEYQWTKTFVPLTEELRRAFYDECQGIIDIAVKLYKMVQWRAISLGGNELITVDLIRRVAQEGLYIVKPMLDYIKNPKKKDWAIRYKDVGPVDTGEFEKKCLSELEAQRLEEVRRLARAQQKQSKYSSEILSYVILELLKLNVEPILAKECTEKALDSCSDKENIPDLVKTAYTFALQGNLVKAEPAKSKRGAKAKSEYQEGDIRGIVASAKKEKIPAYEALKRAGAIKDNPVEEFLGLM